MKQLLVLFSVLGALAPAATFAADRAEDHWDLTSIYKDEKEWRAGMDRVTSELKEMGPCKGHLTDSAGQLKKCLDKDFAIQMQTQRLEAWARLQQSADRKTNRNNERADIASDFSAKVGQELAFIEPELARAGRDTLTRLEGKSDDLKVYHQYLRTIADHAEHTLDTAREEMLASLGPVLHSGEDTLQLLLTSDIPWRSETLSGGKRMKVDQATYTKYRTSLNRADRQKVFAAFYAELGSFEHTLGANLARSVKTDVILAKNRKYPSALVAALDPEKIPEEVYRTLVQEVNRGLPALHDYLKFQKESLGLREMSYIDVYAPTTKWPGKFPLELTRKTVIDALAPLGPDYIKRFSQATSARWMDVYPREGKQGGAFMDPSVFELHPFLLLNHQDDFTSASTFAHEWGHAMHSVYSNESQPFLYANYATFIAEIASTTNEVLLDEYMIKHAKSPAEKSFYLDALLQLIRGTFYRQTQFAEFELALHEEIEKGAALSGERISAIYGEIARRYYGHDQGVVKFDKAYNVEWGFVPHFFNRFYVYQYATSISAAFYFAESILEQKPGVLENYQKVLRAGSSKYPYEILKDAGVDMKSPEVYQAVVKRAQSAVNELRSLKSAKH